MVIQVRKISGNINQDTINMGKETGKKYNLEIIANLSFPRQSHQIYIFILNICYMFLMFVSHLVTVCLKSIIFMVTL